MGSGPLERFDEALWADARTILKNDALPANPSDLSRTRRCQIAQELHRQGWPSKRIGATLGGLPLEWRWLRKIDGLNWWLADLLQPIEGIVLIVVMIVLLYVGGRVLMDAGRAIFRAGQAAKTVGGGTNQNVSFPARITQIISDGLLIVIVLELVETIRQQVQVRERLSGKLVRNFLIIGIVSAIRHLLALGAQLSLGSPETDVSVRRSLLLELGVNAAIVLALLAGYLLIVRYGPEPMSEGHN
jgi:hypothetical protein